MGLQSLDISKRLSAEGIEPRQAEAIASAIVLAADGSSGILPTREDLAATRGELKRDIADLKVEIQTVRTDLKRDVADLRTELKHDIAELRTELKHDIAELRAEQTGHIQSVRGEMSTMKSDLQLAIEKTRNQMILSIAAIAGLVLLVDRLLG